MELESNNIHKCKPCDKLFDHKTKLKGHIHKVHNQKSLKCHSCEFLSLCQAELRRHKETVHEGRNRRNFSSHTIKLTRSIVASTAMLHWVQTSKSLDF